MGVRGGVILVGGAWSGGLKESASMGDAIEMGHVKKETVAVGECMGGV